MYHGVPIIDDYAHHPTEIAATLAAARSILPSSGKIFAIFQPHTYSRAIAFLDDFAKVLKGADQGVVTDIYSAREKNLGMISGASMADYFIGHGLSAKYITAFEEIADFIKSCVVPGDIVITLGAGDVNKIIDIILK